MEMQPFVSLEMSLACQLALEMSTDQGMLGGEAALGTPGLQMGAKSRDLIPQGAFVALRFPLLQRWSRHNFLH